MLVARQHTEESRPRPAAAEHLERVLRSWGPGPNHLTGLALAGIALPSRLGPRFVDALVFTRCGVVVIAAHEPGPAEWPGPGDRTGLAVAAARGALAGHEGGRHVTGLVAVVPPAERRGDAAGERDLRLGEWAAVAAGGPEVAGPADAASGSEAERPNEPAPKSPSQRAILPGGPAAPAPAPPPGPPALHWPEPKPVAGVAVVLADPRGLRRIIAQHNRWRTVWSADDVLDACYALSLAHLAPPRAALIADGFPARLPVLDRLPELPAVVPVPTEPAPAPVEDEPVAWTPSARAVVFPRQRPIRQVPWVLLFVLTVLVAAGVVAAVFVNQVFHGS
ncbi:hypothetical protein SAMN04489727_5432 [Amycolatopsis tolypomycina]|uniref:Nuclease-related domain-containing protein n=1 Tax=Amycolatopsis tolypomycina TaxID=208445 RepID=A0A1H4W357_9PSEU|nr:hypothetical protein [Amycolatopsis tolypomycina]SEC87802.1 hypothetical protein SAMN04489727_5432 [Amycolatopsis tolypomycina]